MCKVFMTAGVKKQNVDKMWKFIKAHSKYMSMGNRDGIGYAAINATGELFGERWLSNDQAFKVPTSIDSRIIDVFGQAIESKEEKIDYTSFGNIDRNDFVAFTMHTRYATSPKGMMNVHPFVDEGVSIIHNGVIRNDNEFHIKLSTCDSEAVLRAYINEKVADDANNIQYLADSLKGYYSVGALTNTSEGPILDIFKYNASQHVVFIEELETWVLATSENDIKDTCKELGYTMGQVFTILNEKFIRVNAITGKEIIVLGFQGNADTGYSSSTGGHGGYNSKFNNYNTPASSSIKVSEQAVESAKEKVVPMYKKKKNTELSPDLRNYFLSGKVTCEALTEREIQEEIMEQEHFYGRI